MTPTPGGGKRRSRWDETPQAATPGGSTPITPALATPGGGTPMLGGPTPIGTQAMHMQTPTPGNGLLIFFQLILTDISYPISW